MEIKNSLAIISGGASGIGAATARMLHKAGARVAILDVNLSAAKSVAASLDGVAVECDVTNADSVKRAIETTGPARVCINCAGILKARRMINQQGVMPVDEFRQVIEVNLIGTFNMMTLAAEAMMTLDLMGEERGVIINTASVAAFEGQIGQTAYSASKGGVVSLTLPAARELAQFGIRVMGIAPGLVDTPMIQNMPDKARTALIETIPFPKRLAFPDEYAKLALHIIDNAMLNGEVIRLDGALRMQAK